MKTTIGLTIALCLVLGVSVAFAADAKPGAATDTTMAAAPHAAMGDAAVKPVVETTKAAAKKPLPPVTRVAGTISATKDDQGKVTAIKLTTEDGSTVNVVVDEKSLKMVEDYKDARVIVTGVPTEVKVTTARTPEVPKAPETPK